MFVQTFKLFTAHGPHKEKERREEDSSEPRACIGELMVRGTGWLVIIFFWLTVLKLREKRGKQQHTRGEDGKTQEDRGSRRKKRG